MTCKALLPFIFGIALFMSAVLPAIAQGDIEQHPSCSHCGMDRKAYGYSRMLVVYTDGSKVGVCSLHCAAIELTAHPDKYAALHVADRNNHDLIDAAKAVWVSGGRKRGVMTTTPTWAFATREAAERFIRDYGGTLSTWEKVLAAARREVVQ